ncbi:DUF2637 domain-containing protein [Streptomyces triculaminicus]|uniref:DUF2637 domain-containing protein n=1 Tax=Streptomyces triculaminicus TaxID=2816232 RepID=UPI0037AB5E64
MTAQDAAESAPAMRRDVLLYMGMSAVGLAAAASSYAALQDLALRTGWWSWLSWLLPLTVDAYAMTAVRVWLGRSTRSQSARTWAKANAIGGIALSVAGNAVDHAASAGVIAVSWPLIVAVSAIPPVVLGLLVHLAHLHGQAPAEAIPAASPLAPSGSPAMDTPAEAAEQAADADEPVPLPPAPEVPPAPVETRKRRAARRRVAESRQRQALPPGKSDDDLIAAARRRMAEGQEPSATWLMKTYGIGTSRAARIRDAATRQPPAEVADAPGREVGDRMPPPNPPAPDPPSPADPEEEPRPMTTAVVPRQEPEQTAEDTAPPSTVDLVKPGKSLKPVTEEAA